MDKESGELEPPAEIEEKLSQCVGKLLSVSAGLLVVFARFLHAFYVVSLLVLELAS